MPSRFETGYKQCDKPVDSLELQTRQFPPVPYSQRSRNLVAPSGLINISRECLHSFTVRVRSDRQYDCSMSRMGTKPIGR